MKKTNEMIYNNILQKLKASKKPNELEGKECGRRLCPQHAAEKRAGN